MPDQTSTGRLPILRSRFFNCFEEMGIFEALEFPRVNMKVLVAANDRMLAQWVTGPLKAKRASTLASILDGMGFGNAAAYRFAAR